MKEKLQKQGILFRPHFKTHQSRYIGKLFKEQGINSITVSSVSMAEYFADDFDDILIAFPANILEAERIAKLAGNIKLSLLFDHVDQVNAIDKALNHKCSAFIKIDTGNRRAGINYENSSDIQKIADAIINSENLQLKGVLSHPGHTYHTNSTDAVFEIYKDNINKLKHARNNIKNVNSYLMISSGDTPSSSIVDDLSGADELRPGVFAFYDMMMHDLGACKTENIAIAMACPVISKYAERNEILIYGGAVHFSKDKIQKNDGDYFGAVVKFDESMKWSEIEQNSYHRMISQEHGVISCDQQFFDSVNIGDIIGILPIHACLTIDKAWKVISTYGIEIDRMKI
jgi:D-serine deaminase-like pyridoxal phosphate-dependent protein